jgi:hypothetical protein
MPEPFCDFQAAILLTSKSFILFLYLLSYQAGRSSGYAASDASNSPA